MPTQAEVARKAISQQSQLTDYLRGVFLEAVATQGKKINLAALAKLISGGRINEAIDLCLAASGVHDFAVAATDNAIATAAKQVPREIPFTFNSMNPSAVSWLQNYQFRLIVDLNTKQRKAIQTILVSNVQNGINPIDSARDIKALIGLTDVQAQAVLNYRNDLMTRTSGALQRALRDKRFDSTVRRAIANDQSLSKAQIDNMVERYRLRYIQYRARVIARTESLTALNWANREVWVQAVSQGKIAASSIKRFWIYTKDEHTRLAHRAVPGMNEDGVGLNEPFQTPLGPMMFPGDPNGEAANRVQCRCTQFIRYSPP